MCVAIPAKIIEMNETGTEAVVDVEGVRRTASLMLVADARVGDYVILHAGYAISIIDENDAAESLAILREVLWYTKRYPVFFFC